MDDSSHCGPMLQEPQSKEALLNEDSMKTEVREHLPTDERLHWRQIHTNQTKPTHSEE